MIGTRIFGRGGLLALVGMLVATPAVGKRVGKSSSAGFQIVR
jgi:hypothetical protein